MNMWPFTRRTPATLYLGTVSAKRRRDFLKRLEADSSGALSTVLLSELESVLALPPVSAAPHGGNALKVDVTLEAFRKGGWDQFSLGLVDFPLIWRPMVTVCARVSSLTAAKSQAQFRVIERMSWGGFFSSLLPGKVQLGVTSPGGRVQLEELARAGERLKKKIQDLV